ncbi:MAG: LamG-like jellyroll fold domain-containing protein [Candidatus Moraniibacteriota bacterium]
MVRPSRPSSPTILYTGLIDNASYDLLIGAWRSSGGGVNDYFDGVIDEARVYNRALSATEVKSLYDLGASDKVNSSISQSQGTGRLDSGLALYWPLDAASGTSAVDSSTNGNNGTLTNMEDPGDWVTGQIANALDFDGSNEYVTVADPASGVLDAVGDQYYTLSGWFNRDTATTTDTILAKSNGPADTMGYLVYLDATTDKLVFATRSTLGDNIYETTSAYTAPGWHHFAIIFNIPRTGGNRGQIYIDGSIQNDNIGGGGYAGSIESTRAFVIGAESDGGNPFDGKLDEVRIYNRTLSADEVGQLYRLTSPTGTDTSLKGYWSFNGQDLSGTTAADRSGAGNNGTLTNGPTITEGKLGQALNFDGTNDTVSISPTGLPTGSRTISVWAKATLLDGSYRGVIGYGNQNNGEAFAIQINSSNEWVITGWGAPNAVSGGAVVLNQWTHIVGTYSGGNASIYVNGVLVGGPAAITSAPNLNYSAIGSRLDGGGDYFPGQIDEVRIYNRVLSDTEVKALYNSGR